MSEEKLIEEELIDNEDEAPVRLAIVAEFDKNDNERRYYVYALIDPEDNQVFYIGKGQRGRVWQHELGADNERKAIKKLKLSDEEKSRLIEDISKKHDRINKIKQKGNDVQKVIIKWGLTEEEAFAAESALINLYKYRRVNLTNMQNGHASEKEKNSNIKTTEAMTVESFYKKNAKPPIIFDDLRVEKIGDKIGVKIICVDFKKYKANMPDNVIRDIARGRWKSSCDSVNKDINNKKYQYYLFVINNCIIRGVYRITAAHMGNDIVDFPEIEGEDSYNDIREKRKNEKERLKNFRGETDEDWNLYKRVYYSVEDVGDDSIIFKDKDKASIKYKDLKDCIILNRNNRSIFSNSNPIRTNYGKKR